MALLSFFFCSYPVSLSQMWLFSLLLFRFRTHFGKVYRNCVPHQKLNTQIYDRKSIVRRGKYVEKVWILQNSKHRKMLSSKTDFFCNQKQHVKIFFSANCEIMNSYIFEEKIQRFYTKNKVLVGMIKKLLQIVQSIYF